jgi:hypothetical protein
MGMRRYRLRSFVNGIVGASVRSKGHPPVGNLKFQIPGTARVGDRCDCQNFPGNGKAHSDSIGIDPVSLGIQEVDIISSGRDLPKAFSDPGESLIFHGDDYQGYCAIRDIRYSDITGGGFAVGDFCPVFSLEGGDMLHHYILFLAGTGSHGGGTDSPQQQTCQHKA